MYFMRILTLFIVSICLSANAQDIGVPISSTLTVTFSDSVTKFDPPPESKLRLEQASEAVLIYISGRTSTRKPSPKDEALAFKRAASARAYLIDNGISPLKIMLNYVSAADYIAENDTPWGRQNNQRVEIEMIFLPGMLSQYSLWRTSKGTDLSSLLNHVGYLPTPII